MREIILYFVIASITGGFGYLVGYVIANLDRNIQELNRDMIRIKAEIKRKEEAIRRQKIADKLLQN